MAQESLRPVKFENNSIPEIASQLFVYDLVEEKIEWWNRLPRIFPKSGLKFFVFCQRHTHWFGRAPPSLTQQYKGSTVADHNVSDASHWARHSVLFSQLSLVATCCNKHASHWQKTQVPGVLARKQGSNLCRVFLESHHSCYRNNKHHSPGQIIERNMFAYSNVPQSEIPGHFYFISHLLYRKNHNWNDFRLALSQVASLP